MANHFSLFRMISGYRHTVAIILLLTLTTSGPGAMADVTSIVNRVLKNLERINGISHSDPVESCSLDTWTL